MQGYPGLCGLGAVLYCLLQSSLVMPIGGVHTFVDTSHCTDLQGLLDVSGGTTRRSIEYDDVATVAAGHHSNTPDLHILQPELFFSSHIEGPSDNRETIMRAAHVMRKYRLEEMAMDSRVVAMLTNVVRVNDTNNTSMRHEVGQVIRNTDLGAMFIDQYTTRAIVKECFWYMRTPKRSDARPQGGEERETLVHACVLVLQHDSCVYLSDRSMGARPTTHPGLPPAFDRGNWVWSLISTMSGMGVMKFQVDWDETELSNGVTSCESEHSHTTMLVRGFPFRQCSKTIVLTCFLNGAVCSAEQFAQELARFWRVYSIYSGSDLQHISVHSLALTHQTGGAYTVQYDTTRIVEHHGGHTQEDRYFLGEIARECLPGTVPQELIIKEFGFFYVAKCKPCPINYYYYEGPTLRTALTEDNTKERTLFVSLVDSVYVLTNGSVANGSVANGSSVAAVDVGTTVTIHIDPMLRFRGIRGADAATWSVSGGVGQTVLLSIANIYGEDDEHADDAIFIDVEVAPSGGHAPVADSRSPAILPIRHTLEQKCVQCPEGTVSESYASKGRSECLAFEGLRTSVTDSIAPSHIGRDSHNAVFDTIAGFQLRQVRYDGNRHEMQLYLETEASIAKEHTHAIMASAKIFFGVAATDQTTFEVIGVTTLAPNPDAPTDSRRRHLLDYTWHPQANSRAADSGALASITIRVRGQDSAASDSAGTPALDARIIVFVIIPCVVMVIILMLFTVCMLLHRAHTRHTA